MGSAFRKEWRICSTALKTAVMAVTLGPLDCILISPCKNLDPKGWTLSPKLILAPNGGNSLAPDGPAAGKPAGVTPQHWPKHLRSHVHSLQGNLPLSHYTWDHTSTVSRITASQTLYMRSHVFGSQGDPSQTLYLGSHVHSFYCDHPPRHCTWAYTLTVSIMMPFPRPCTWVLCTHIHILQGDSLPRPCEVK